MVKTVEEAQALPEVERDWWIRPGAKFGIRGIEGDDILIFQDVDGRCMEVVGTEHGERKCEAG